MQKESEQPEKSVDSENQGGKGANRCNDMNTLRKVKNAGENYERRRHLNWVEKVGRETQELDDPVIVFM